MYRQRWLINATPCMSHQGSDTFVNPCGGPSSFVGGSGGGVIQRRLRDTGGDRVTWRREFGKEPRLPHGHPVVFRETRQSNAIGGDKLSHFLIWLSSFRGGNLTRLVSRSALESLALAATSDLELRAIAKIRHQRLAFLHSVLVTTERIPSVFSVMMLGTDDHCRLHMVLGVNRP